ncbi:hypothetical protein NC653_015163 [Populus alba x Populus x berolinensis]|uniref:Uncharacterized protein n=1 Tax=Populus alba x Populus x berolinensis TaxID=444605 RepID=A0AAD6VXW3_9ROSI|nr:hypothetical protein NC653_015163 [Populus alba x Populus x berolinensis]
MPLLWISLKTALLLKFHAVREAIPRAAGFVGFAWRRLKMKIIRRSLDSSRALRSDSSSDFA